MHPLEKLGVNTNKVFGIEDLTEIPLDYAARKQSESKSIPVLGGIIRGLHYYAEKSLVGTKHLEV